VGDRLRSLGLGALRMLMVAAALVVAFAGVGLSAVSTFCPDPVSAPVSVPTSASSPEAVQSEADGATGGGGSCPGGDRACAPPLLSTVLRYGDADCAEQASGALRMRLVPAVLVSTALLGGAWALRPRFGDAILSRG
jgi:hypothetical protein